MGGLHQALQPSKDGTQYLLRMERMEKLTRVSEANRVSRVSRVSTFYIYARIRARGCICFGILLTLPTLLARG